jgi:hypothetical protein
LKRAFYSRVAKVCLSRVRACLRISWNDSPRQNTPKFGDGNSDDGRLKVDCVRRDRGIAPTQPFITLRRSSPARSSHWSFAFVLQHCNVKAGMTRPVAPRRTGHNHPGTANKNWKCAAALRALQQRFIGGDGKHGIDTARNGFSCCACGSAAGVIEDRSVAAVLDFNARFQSVGATPGACVIFVQLLTCD